MAASPQPATAPRPSARARVIVAVLVPVFVLLAFSGYVVHEKLGLYRQSLGLLAAAQATRSAQALAHELADERSLSSFFIGTGRTSWKPELDEQRAETDAHVEDLRKVVQSAGPGAQPWAPYTGQTIALLADARAKVDGAADVKASLDAYGEIITPLMGASTRLVHENLSNLVAAYLDLGQIKDQVGRERSIGSAVLLQATPDPALLTMCIEAHGERIAFIQSFRSHATQAQLRIFGQMVPETAFAAVDRLHALAVGGKLGSDDAATWFRAHLDLAEGIVRAEDRLAVGLEAEIVENLNNAKNTFYAVFLVVIGLLAFSIETLRRSEARAVRAEGEARKLSRAIEQSPVSVVITDTAGAIEYVNPAFTRMTGFSREEVIGRNPRILRSATTDRAMHKDLWRTISRGQEWRGEIVNKRRDGTTYWERMTIAPVKAADGELVNYIALKEDVTEVRALRLALEQEHANVRRILNATHDCIALVDPDCRFEYANPALEAEFGLTGGRVCHEYFGADACGTCRRHLPPRYEWRSEKTGKIYETTTTPILNPDGTESLLQVFHDITVRKQAEDALKSAHEAAEMANRAKSEFLATMSHELRTPLNAIIGFSEIIASEMLGTVGEAGYVDYARDINQSGRHLLQLIDDILDVARIDVDRLALREVELDVAAIVRAALNMVRDRASAGSVSIAADLPPDLPRLRADERRLKQILVNLLGNGIKFTPPGGAIEVRAGLTPAGAMRIEVVDTGIGIAADDIPKVMTPFGQADSTLTRRYQGSGLGLPLSCKLMEVHGGSLALRSRPGHGTTVTLTFPRDRVCAE